MSSDQLICPLCEETLKKKGVHFHKHFKYRPYPCAGCDEEFYDEADRNTHCIKTNHKRCFQKTSNPYIEKLIDMIATDARSLVTNSMQEVLDNRFGADPDITIVSTSKSATRTIKMPKESPSESTPSTSESVTIKKRALVLEKTGSSKKSKSSSSSAPRSDETPRRPAKEKDIPSTSTAPAPAPEVHSTTSETLAPEKQKKKKKQSAVAAPENAPDAANKTYEDMSSIEKWIGWFDPSVPERRDAAKVECAVCKQEIVYDYILRKNHVTKDHMAADVAPEDYEEIVKAAMEKSFPDLPNTNLACQLCMTCLDIPRSRRREHIEKNHTTSLPPLECPFDGCKRGFRRQCDLSGHMKDSHKLEMSRHKDSAFQTIRRYRNVMINTLIEKCFPWAPLEAIEKPLKASLPEPSSTERLQNPNPNPQRLRTNSEQVQPLGDFSLDTDVRVLERSHNKTRRAPVYNHRDSSSDSSDSDDDEHQAGDSTGAKSPVDYTQEIMIIGVKFNSEVAEKLSQRSLGIKQEVVQHESDVVLDEDMDIETAEKEDLKEEVTDEDMKEETQAPQVAATAQIVNTVPLMNLSIPPPPPFLVYPPPPGLIHSPVIANQQAERSQESPGSQRAPTPRESSSYRVFEAPRPPQPFYETPANYNNYNRNSNPHSSHHNNYNNYQSSSSRYSSSNPHRSRDYDRSGAHRRSRSRSRSRGSSNRGYRRY